MKGERLRSPAKPDYVAALGLATYTFATLEWQVVWCSERIRPGMLRKLVGANMTAGKIAKSFIDTARNMPEAPERQQLISAAQEFARLVGVRNSIVHGKPCTGPNGQARLSAGNILELSDLEDAADAFSACAVHINRLFYGYFLTYEPRSTRA